MASGTGNYSVHGAAQTVSTAITILTIAAPSTGALFIDRVWVNQTTITAVGTRTRVQILRKSAAITGTASPPTPTPLNGTQTSQATVAWIATAEGTDGNVLYDEAFDYVPGYLWIPANMRERIWVPPSGIVGIKFPVAPTSASFEFGIAFEEMD